jgi:hypothetical protein
VTKPNPATIPAQRHDDAAPALRVLVSGPCGSPAALALLDAEAALLRAEGHAVTTPGDLVRQAGAPVGSVAYARASAEAFLEADALVLLDGWAEDSDALASADIAEVLGLARVV